MLSNELDKAAMQTEQTKKNQWWPLLPPPVQGHSRNMSFPTRTNIIKGCLPSQPLRINDWASL